MNQKTRQAINRQELRRVMRFDFSGVSDTDASTGTFTLNQNGVDVDLVGVMGNTQLQVGENAVTLRGGDQDLVMILGRAPFISG